LDTVTPLGRGTYRAGRIDVDGLFRDLSVSSTEAEIVVRLARTRRRVTAVELADTRYPDKLVEKARRKIDIEVDGCYRSIRTHGHGDTKTYELAPDAGIGWCVVVPLDPPPVSKSPPTA
jgi:chromosome condensin MukBEF ATPase and DNA-binding subunit MukB